MSEPVTPSTPTRLIKYLELFRVGLGGHLCQMYPRNCELYLVQRFGQGKEKVAPGGWGEPVLPAVPGPWGGRQTKSLLAPWCPVEMKAVSLWWVSSRRPLWLRDGGAGDEQEPHLVVRLLAWLCSRCWCCSAWFAPQQQAQAVTSRNAVLLKWNSVPF